MIAYLWMLLSSLAFAVMGVLVHGLRDRCDWQVLLLARITLQLSFAALLARSAGVSLHVWGPPRLWVRSVAGSIAMLCQFFAYTRLPVSDVLTLANTFPIWVALLSWPLLGRSPSPATWLAAGSGVLGVFLIQQHFGDDDLANLLALASSLFTAIAMIALHRLRDIDPRAIIVHFSAVTLLFCVASLFLFKRSFSAADLGDTASLLSLFGVGVGALAGQWYLTKAFAAGDAARVSVVGLTQIVFGLAFDLLLFGYTFTPTTLLGMALVAAPTGWLLASRTE
jgi:drug/metabolite transporter (DMT)-like permease